MKKRVFSIFLTLAMILSLFAVVWTPVGALTATSGWYDRETEDGSPNELNINNAEDYLAFAAALQGGKTFAGCVIRLTADIDFGGRNVDPTKSLGGQSASATKGDIDTIAPNVSAQGTFSGILDGQGHTLQGIVISQGTSNYVSGLACYMKVSTATPNANYGGASAGIFNLYMKDLSVRGKGTDAGLIGLIQAGTGKIAFENVIVEGEICASGTPGSSAVGGLIAKIEAGSEVEIKNCLSESNLYTYFGNNSNAGGLVGDNLGKTTIENSCFNGTINDLTTKGEVGKFGGFVGCTEGTAGNSSLTIKNSICYATFHFNDTTEKFYNMGVILGVKTAAVDLTIENVIGVGTETSLYNIVSGAGSVSESKVAKVTSVVTTGINATLSAPGVDLTPYFIAIPDHCPVPVALAATQFRSAVTDYHENNTNAITQAARYQTTPYTDGQCDLRLIGLLNGDTSDYSAVGFEIYLALENGNTWSNLESGETLNITKVYTSVLAAGESVTAQTLGGDYIFLAVVSPIVKGNGDLTIFVKTFHVDQEDVKTYDDIAVFVFDTNAD